MLRTSAATIVLPPTSQRAAMLDTYHNRYMALGARRRYLVAVTTREG